MTEGNTQITLHDESLADLIAVLRQDASVPSMEKRRTIANTIEAQMTRPETVELELRKDSVAMIVGMLEMSDIGIANFPPARRNAIAARIKQQT